MLVVKRSNVPVKVEKLTKMTCFSFYQCFIDWYMVAKAAGCVFIHFFATKEVDKFFLYKKAGSKLGSLNVMKKQPCSVLTSIFPTCPNSAFFVFVFVLFLFLTLKSQFEIWMEENGIEADDA